jgi:hypothetical protein
MAAEALNMVGPLQQVSQLAQDNPALVVGLALGLFGLLHLVSYLRLYRKHRG